jgi:hypothetical protein
MPGMQNAQRLGIETTTQFFSIFFIPLIPLSKAKGEFVQCLHCGTEMPSTVLNHAQPE